MMRRFPTSLRARLTIWYTVVLALVLVAFALLSYNAIARAVALTTDDGLRNAAAALGASIAEEVGDRELHGAVPTDASVRRSVAEVVDAFRFDEYHFEVLDAGLRPIGPADGVETVPRERVDALVSSAARDGEALDTFAETRPHARILALRATARGFDYTIVVARSLETQEQLLSSVRRAFGAGVPFVVVCAALGGSLLARKSLAPIVAMSDQAERIEATSLHERLKVAGERDEIGRLARVFNALLARLERSFDAQRRFMADASHELRTSVAVVRGESEVALAGGDRTSDDYRDSLEIIHDEGKRLSRIVEDLFTLARADTKRQPLEIGEFYLDEAIGDSVRAVRSLAARRGVAVVGDACEEMPARGDETLVVRLFVNLLDNAIKHTPEGGEVRVHAGREGARYRVTVADTGSGIPPEAQPYVFDRFYRADAARARGEAGEGSGAGLGLSIVRWIAEAHGGCVDLASSSERGTTFAVTLPAPDAERSRDVAV
jgi:heavy metal sensor kinase